MSDYEAPKITQLGSVQDLTQSTIHKSTGGGDVIIIDGTDIEIPVPGGTVTGVS
jgi:hypothetical protein